MSNISPKADVGDDPGSVTVWIDALKGGDLDAAGPLWERYFDRLVHLARARLRSGRRGGDADEEDVALSAFDSFCRGARADQYPRLADRDDLWRLLLVITARKAMNQVRRAVAAKRGGGRVLDEAALVADDSAAGGLEQAPARDLTPELAAAFAEEFQRLIEALRDDRLRQVAVWKLEGYTNAEVAERLGRSARTVAYQLELIRKTWARELDLG